MRTSNYTEEKYTGKWGTNCSRQCIHTNSKIHYKTGK